jgi:hypothetical protein
MPRYASTEIRIANPSEAELGYLAGIIDGEGFFAVTERSNAFGLGVQMLDLSVISWLHTHFQGFVSPGSLTVTGRRAWRWALQRQADLRFVLDRLEPLLLAKRRQAQMMLRLLDHLAQQPRYTYPTARVTRRERDRRREARCIWNRRESLLRRAVADARRPVVAPSAVDGQLAFPTSHAEFGYLAGILDGEGYFMPGLANRVVALRVVVTDRAIVDFLGSRFAGCITEQRRVPGRQPTFEWRLQCRAQLRSTLLAVRALLVCKRRQAEAMLAWIDFADSRERGQQVWGVEGLALRRAIRDARHQRP